MTNQLHLTHIGRDSHNRPVYKDENGRLYKDVDPRPRISITGITTVQNNAFDGEPDTPIYALPAFQHITVIFHPERDLW